MAFRPHPICCLFRRPMDPRSHHLWLRQGQPTHQKSLKALVTSCKPSRRESHCRVMAPDSCWAISTWKNTKLTLLKLWNDYGFVEAQTFAHHMWGQIPTNTCHHKTRKDHLWLSREILPFVRKVVVDDTWFSDHALVYAEIAPMAQWSLSQFGENPWIFHGTK